jgi:amino acid permease
MKIILKGISLAGVLVAVIAYFAFPVVMQAHAEGASAAVQNETTVDNGSYLLPAQPVQSVPVPVITAVVLTFGIGAGLHISVASDLRVLRWYQNKKLERRAAHGHVYIHVHDGRAACVDPSLAYS